MKRKTSTSSPGHPRKASTEAVKQGTPTKSSSRRLVPKDTSTPGEDDEEDADFFTGRPTVRKKESVIDILNTDPPWSPAETTQTGNGAPPAARRVPAVVVGVSSKPSPPSLGPPADIISPTSQPRLQPRSETTLPEAHDSLAYGRKPKTTAQELADFFSSEPPPADWTAARQSLAEVGGQKPTRFKALVNRIVGKTASSINLEDGSPVGTASPSSGEGKESFAPTASQDKIPSSSFRGVPTSQRSEHVPRRSTSATEQLDHRLRSPAEPVLRHHSQPATQPPPAYSASSPSPSQASRDVPLISRRVENLGSRPQPASTSARGVDARAEREPMERKAVLRDLSHLADRPAQTTKAASGHDQFDRSKDKEVESASRLSGQPGTLETDSNTNGAASAGIDETAQEDTAGSRVDEIAPRPSPPRDDAVASPTEPVIALRELASLRQLLAHASTADECRLLVNAVLAQWKVGDWSVHTPESRVAAWLLAGGDGPPA
jgi:hypothetical protein